MLNKLVVATGNKGKLREIREILSDVEVLGLSDVGIDVDVEETGTTFAENAFIKADAISKMVDHSCSEELEQQIAECAAAQENVLEVDMIQTRVFGNKIYVDIEISADGSKSLFEGHEIAQAVHDAIENQFPEVKHIMVHVNPA